MSSGDDQIFEDQLQDGQNQVLQSPPLLATAELDENEDQHDIDQESAIGSSHGYVFSIVIASYLDHTTTVNFLYILLSMNK